MNDVTCLMPMYRTARHLEILVPNIDGHLARGCHVLLSDQHSLDHAAEHLSNRYRNEPRVRVFVSDGGGDWVANTNLLLERVETQFFRIMPHDDSVPAQATEYLAQTLRSRPDAVLCHGRVLAVDMEGNRIEERDEPNMPLVPRSCQGPDGFSLGFFPSGLFSGCFKAVIRTRFVQSEAVYLRKTPGLVHAERAWLFALSLFGEFLFDRRATLTKRYWEGSLTAGWRSGSPEVMAATECMAGYVDDLVADPERRHRLRFNLYFNALRRAQWFDGVVKTCPLFSPLQPQRVDACSLADVERDHLAPVRRVSP